MDAESCSCTIYTSITEGGDTQRHTHSHFPSPVSLFILLSISHSLFSGKGVRAFSKLPALLNLPFGSLFFFFSLSFLWCVPTNPAFHLQGPSDTFICSFPLAEWVCLHVLHNEYIMVTRTLREQVEHVCACGCNSVQVSHLCINQTKHQH